MFSVLYSTLEQKLGLKNRVVEVQLLVLIDSAGQSAFHHEENLILRHFRRSRSQVRTKTNIKVRKFLTCVRDCRLLIIGILSDTFPIRLTCFALDPLDSIEVEGIFWLTSHAFPSHLPKTGFFHASEYQEESRERINVGALWAYPRQ